MPGQPRLEALLIAGIEPGSQFGQSKKELVADFLVDGIVGPEQRHRCRGLLRLQDDDGAGNGRSGLGGQRDTGEREAEQLEELDSSLAAHRIP